LTEHGDAAIRLIPRLGHALSQCNEKALSCKLRHVDQLELSDGRQHADAIAPGYGASQVG
jgi:hypothetical protein